MSTAACYVTGETIGLSPYYFGTEQHVRLALTQEAFGYFIVRAGKDTMHQQIMADIKNAVMELDAAEKQRAATKINTDASIDASIESAIKADKLANLLTQKCESGVRILRSLKKEFEQTGKLSG
jgi:hypothetical protein